MSMVPQYCQDDNSEFTIYIFNAKDNVIYPVIKNCFDLSDSTQLLETSCFFNFDCILSRLRLFEKGSVHGLFPSDLFAACAQPFFSV